MDIGESKPFSDMSTQVNSQAALVSTSAMLTPFWYPSVMQVWINGQQCSFPDLLPEARLDQMIAALAIQADRIAVEHNGEIVPRTSWGTATIHEGDRFEIVHFVGGGAC